MENQDRNVFGIHGVAGMLIATVLLLTILAVLVTNAISVQHREATNYYTVDQDINSLKFIDANNAQYYKLENE
jgi:cell division protein FtsB